MTDRQKVLDGSWGHMKWQGDEWLVHDSKIISLNRVAFPWKPVLVIFLVGVIVGALIAGLALRAMLSSGSVTNPAFVSENDSIAVRVRQVTEGPTSMHSAQLRATAYGSLVESPRTTYSDLVFRGHGDPTTQNAVEPTPAPTVRQIIASAARVWNVDPALLDRIAFCESTYRPNAANTQSDARGLFQHISTTWTANVARMHAPYTLADRTNPAASSEVAAFMISQGNIGAWASSEHCWR